MLAYDGLTSAQGKMLYGHLPKGVTPKRAKHDQQVMDEIWRLAKSRWDPACGGMYHQAPNGTTYLSLAIGLTWKAAADSPAWACFTWGAEGKRNLFACIGVRAKHDAPVCLATCWLQDRRTGRYSDDLPGKAARLFDTAHAALTGECPDRLRWWAQKAVSKPDAAVFLLGLFRRKRQGLMPGNSRLAEAVNEVMNHKGANVPLLAVAAAYGRVVQERQRPLGQLDMLRAFTEFVDQEWPVKRLKEVA